MLKKTITYEDFNEEEITEDLFFHLSKAELVELEMSYEGGLSTALAKIIAAEDGKEIIAEFKKIILGAYGKKSLDGRRFIKTQELRDEFESTEAYSTLFMELVTNTDAAIEFVNGIIPAGMAEETAKLALAQKNVTEIAAEPSSPVLTPVREVREVTRKEIAEMTSDELVKFGESVASGEAEIVE